MVQRVSRAAVDVAGERVGAIEMGLFVLLSIGHEDDEDVARRFAGRIATLRIFPDAAGHMNLDLAAAGGAALVVSQFTLHADTSRGHRPSFIRAAAPGRAAQLYASFVVALRGLGFTVATGTFGAHMQVELVNDGPVTLVVSSGEQPWAAHAG